jgi:5-methylcytosine-specific restriction endonuclease McrA
MGILIDLTGQTFGKLYVIERIGTSKTGGCALWRCKCSCGKETIVTGSTLRNQTTKSCGCYIKEITSKRMKKASGDSSITQLFNNYKCNARKRGIEFTLSKDEFMTLILSNCYYCNKEPSQKQLNKFNNGDIIYNGIDRTDNTKGYVEENVRTCCFQCNHAKNYYTEDEYVKWVKNVYEYTHSNHL